MFTNICANDRVIVSDKSKVFFLSEKSSWTSFFKPIFIKALHLLCGRSSCGSTIESSRCMAKQMGLIYSTVELIRLLSSIIQLEALWANSARQTPIADQTQITS